ncbi:MAG TPA: glycosyltransferase family 4 protein [Victivallales bacterium]|nr:glycosyltransferase family 4 protein [Victivallales bacterium]
MKIVILNQYCLPCFAPTGRVAYLLGKELADRGHKVTIISSKDSYNNNGVSESMPKVDGLHIKSLFSFCLGGLRYKFKILDQFVYFILALSTLIFSILKYDIVITMTTPPFLGMLGYIINKLFKVKHVEWIMDLYPDALEAGNVMGEKNYGYKFLKHLQTKILSNCDLVIAIGDCMLDRAKEYIDDYERLHSVPICFNSKMVNVNIKSIEKYRKEKGWNTNDLVIMYSGNMGLGHNFLEFLTAAKKLREHKNIKWVYAGAGRRRKEIASFKKNNSDINIELMDYAPAELLNVHLASADVQLISLRENWTGIIVPSKLLDVFAIGKPVIYCGGLNTSISKWISEADGGWCFEEGNIDGIIDAVKEAENSNIRKKKGSNAKKIALKHFNPTVNFNIICKLIENVN